MSEENRDSETGQFTSAEPLFGKAAIEQEAGFVPLPDEPKEVADELTVQEAAEDLALSRRPESQIKTYSALDGLAENVTLTLEQAAAISADESEADAAQTDDEAADAVRAEVDKLRGEKPEADAKSDANTEATAEPSDPKADVEKFLAMPHVAEAVDKWNSETETVRQTYSQATELANDFARASFIENFPEIARLPLEHWEAALGAMAQREPDRFGKAVNSLQRVVQLQAAQQEQNQHREQAERVRRENHSRTQSVIFEEGIKGVARERRAEIEKEIGAAITERGGDLNDVVTFLHTSEASSASVMGLLWELGETRLQLKAITSAKKAVATKQLPPVQRPGVAGPRTSGVNADIQALDRELTATGSLKVAQKLQAAIARSRRARG